MTLSLRRTLQAATRTATIALAGTVLLACGGDDADPTPTPDAGVDTGVDVAPDSVENDAAAEEVTPTIPTLAELSAAVFTPSCATAGCHASRFTQGNLILEAGDALLERLLADSTIGMPHITPGDPDNSYLFLKVTGEFLDVGGAGTRMPSGRPLSASQTELLRQWILAGPELAGR